MENREIAAVFEEISNLLRIVQDDSKWTFKAAAYDRASRSIESFSEKLEDVVRDSNRKLTEIPGIGVEMAAKIKELVETGKSTYHQEQLAKVPHGLLDLLNLQSVGPQKVRLFYNQLGIKSVDDLENAAKDGRLRQLPKMDVKSEENILKAIEELPEKYKEVIVMRHKEDKPYEEIARILHVPVGTVKARIFRARELLKKKLKTLR